MDNKNDEVYRKAEEAINKNRCERLEQYELRRKENERGIANHPDKQINPPKSLWKPKEIKQI